jgi:shikimate kinase
MPGCGKTSIGRLLSRKLGMEVLDFDDDIIEVEMEKSCSDVLCELGEEKFLDMEEKLALNLKLENKILSCSGSVPLKQKAMDYLKTQGHVIYIDIPVKTIEKRLKRMKVDRIV